MTIQDSGNRREFESGAVRDIAEGKGRCDLLPLDVVADLLCDETLRHIAYFVQTGERDSILVAIHAFAAPSLYTALLEVSKHYEDGCQKYGERNWEKGIPLHCYIDSGVRHYIKYLRGDTDERHDRAFLWNMMGALWTMKHCPEMIDLPFADKGRSEADQS